MNDLIKSFKAQLYDRVNSPLSATFIISWCLWNWKILFVLISEMKVNEKFIYIETIIMRGECAWILNGLVYPLIITILYIFAYPYPAKWVFKYSRWQQNELKKIQQSIEKEELISVEDSRALKLSLFEVERKYEYDLGELKKEIRRLEEEKSILASKNIQLEEIINFEAELPPEFDKIMHNVLAIISNKNKNITSDEITREMGEEDKQIHELAIEIAKSKNWVTEDSRSGKPNLEILTKGKRELIVRNKKEK